MISENAREKLYSAAVKVAEELGKMTGAVVTLDGERSFPGVFLGNEHWESRGKVSIDMFSAEERRRVEVEVVPLTPTQGSALFGYTVEETLWCLPEEVEGLRTKFPHLF